MTPRLLLAASLALACAAPPCAWAADAIGYQIGGGNTNTQPVDPAHPLPVTGSFSASFSGFTPTAGATANLSVSTTSADVALPAGASVIVTNTGATDAAFRIQAGAGVATTTDMVLKAGAAIGLAVGSATHLSAITASGTTMLNIQGGAGGATGYGGGSGGGGGGGAVTVADGADVTLGAKADSAAASDAATASLIALVKRTNQNLTTLNTTAGGPIPAGSAVIGKVTIDTTTPGATNLVQDAADGATGSAVPSKATLAGANSSGALAGLIQADSSAFLDMSTATTTQIVALASGKKIYVSAYDLHASGTTNAKFVYGTGTNCATGTTQISSNLNLVAADGVARGNGLGVLFTVPASNALCVASSGAVALSVDVSYTQF